MELFNNTLSQHTSYYHLSLSSPFEDNNGTGESLKKTCSVAETSHTKLNNDLLHSNLGVVYHIFCFKLVNIFLEYTRGKCYTEP